MTTFKVSGVIKYRQAALSDDPHVRNAVDGFIRTYLGVANFTERTEEAWQNYAGIICRRGKTIFIPEWLHDGSAPENVRKPLPDGSMYAAYESVP